MNSGGTPRPTLFLFASNVRAKYFEDCLKALLLPRGLVLHFRYRRNWVQPELQVQIETRAIVEREVVVCFLKQAVVAPNRFKPLLNRPLRAGRIVDAFFKGPSAHIYLAVAGYPLTKELGAISAAADAARAQSADPLFVVETNAVSRSQLTAITDNEDSAFAGVVDSFKEEDLEVINDDGTGMVAVDPLFWRIDGLHSRPKWWNANAQATIMAPAPISAFSQPQRHAGYVLTRDIPIEARVQFYQPLFSRLHNARMAIVVKTDSEHFSNPDEDRIEIQSAYDEGSFILLPVRTDREWLSRVMIQPTPDATYSPVRRPVFASFDAWVDARPAVSPFFRLISAIGTNLATLLLSMAALIVSVMAKAAPNAPLAPWLIGVLVGLGVAAIVLLLLNAYAKLRVGD
jgi:hypothetical protein